MTSKTAFNVRRGKILRFGDCELHVLTRELWFKGQPRTVRRLVFELMILLIEQRPRVVTRAEIVKRVWGRAEVRSSLLAQAIMEARQLTGDDGEDPQYFLSVRGVGYRFTASVTEGAQAASDADLPVELAPIHAAMTEAEEALTAGDMARAQFLADRALTLSEASGINRERARALALAALVAGTLEQAATMASKALRLSELEGHVQVAAQAKVRMAWVRAATGEFHGALALLEAAYPELNAAETVHEKRRCELLLSAVHRELKQFDQAVSWCQLAQATSDLLGASLGSVAVRTFEVDLHLAQAAELTSAEPLDERRACYERALSLNDALYPEVEALGKDADMLCWLGNQGLALAGLGRVDEAWVVAERAQRILDTQPGHMTLNNQRWLIGYLQLRADLLHQSRRYGEALECVQAALETANSASLNAEKTRLLALASRICEQAGQFKDALRWSRQWQAALAAMQLARAANLALVLRAEEQANTLRADLLAMRRQAEQLALENRALMERLSEAEALGTAANRGFAQAWFLREVLASRHAEARARDLPSCLGMLVVDNHAELQAQLDPSTMRQLLQELSRTMSQLIGPSRVVVQWRPWVFVFLLDGMGVKRAAATCQSVADHLNEHPLALGDLDGRAVKLSCQTACDNAADCDHLEQSIERMLASPQGPLAPDLDSA